MAGSAGGGEGGLPALAAKTEQHIGTLSNCVSGIGPDHVPSTDLVGRAEQIASSLSEVSGHVADVRGAITRYEDAARALAEPLQVLGDSITSALGLVRRYQDTVSHELKQREHEQEWRRPRSNRRYDKDQEYLRELGAKAAGSLATVQGHMGRLLDRLNDLTKSNLYSIISIWKRQHLSIQT